MAHDPQTQQLVDNSGATIAGVGNGSSASGQTVAGTAFNGASGFSFGGGNSQPLTQAPSTQAPQAQPAAPVAAQHAQQYPAPALNGQGPQWWFQQPPNPAQYQWPYSAQGQFGYSGSWQGGSANGSANPLLSSAANGGHQGPGPLSQPVLGGQAGQAGQAAQLQAAQGQTQAPAAGMSLFAQGVAAATAQPPCQADNDITMMSTGEAAYRNTLASTLVGTPSERIRQLQLETQRLQRIQAHRAPAMNTDSPQHSPNVDGEGNMRLERDGDGS